MGFIRRKGLASRAKEQHQSTPTGILETGREQQAPPTAQTPVMASGVSDVPGTLQEILQNLIQQQQNMQAQFMAAAVEPPPSATAGAKEESFKVEVKSWLRKARYKTMAKRSPRGRRPHTTQPESAAEPYRQPICIWCKKRHPADLCVRGIRRCSKCGRSGHYQKHCPRNRPYEPASGTTSKQDPYPICGKCGLRHKAVQCLRGTNRCFECGEEGHLIRQCPKKKSADI